MRTLLFMLATAWTIKECVEYRSFAPLVPLAVTVLAVAVIGWTVTKLSNWID